MTLAPVHPVVARVTDAIVARSTTTRAAYLHRTELMRHAGPQRGALSCTNLAHGFAASPATDKLILRQVRQPNVAIVSSYNDMLSAHQPFERFPAVIKAALRQVNATGQFAGGTPAMCDGVTQGQPGMELSLFSRDVIAMSTAIALSHNMFDAVLCLGICDKIVPGLLIGALHFGHLPAVFVPGGPMRSGLSNDEKSKIRQGYTEGKISREELLDAESRAYHGAGTCTFYGTANSNQMLMEVMGLHLPGSAFVHPDTPLRDALTAAAARRAAEIVAGSENYIPLARIVDERAIVNAVSALLATGGSTNHTMHLVAIARAAGILLTWEDFDALSGVVPLIARVYPNGKADVNHFTAAGGTGYVIRELLGAGLLHEDVTTILGQGLLAHAREPKLIDGELRYEDAPAASGDESVLRPVTSAFSPDGGLRLLLGNLGRAVIKVSAVKPEHQSVTAPAAVFDSQQAVVDAFHADQLNRDVIVVVRYQGPRANGMPELHRLTPSLGILQDRGFKVALVTDGRMSGASGKVPAAIHVTPESLAGGALGRVRDGDLITVDCHTGVLHVAVDVEHFNAREIPPPGTSPDEGGMGRELFARFREHADPADQGGALFGFTPMPVVSHIEEHSL